MIAFYVLQRYLVGGIYRRRASKPKRCSLDLTVTASPPSTRVAESAGWHRSLHPPRPYSDAKPQRTRSRGLRNPSRAPGEIASAEGREILLRGCLSSFAAFVPPLRGRPNDKRHRYSRWRAGRRRDEIRYRSGRRHHSLGGFARRHHPDADRPLRRPRDALVISTCIMIVTLDGERLLVRLEAIRLHHDLHGLLIGGADVDLRLGALIALPSIVTFGGSRRGWSGMSLNFTLSDLRRNGRRRGCRRTARGRRRGSRATSGRRRSRAACPRRGRRRRATRCATSRWSRAACCASQLPAPRLAACRRHCLRRRPACPSLRPVEASAPGPPSSPRSFRR